MATMEEVRREPIAGKFRCGHKMNEPEPRVEVEVQPVRHAERRHALHAWKRILRPLSGGCGLAGLAGEHAFCEWTGIDLDVTLRPLSELEDVLGIAPPTASPVPRR